jgi:hypothetical protein
MKTGCAGPAYLWLFTCLLPILAMAYPLDGFEETGIRRVEGSRLAHEGLAEGGKQPKGALLSTAQVDLRLLDHRDLELPPPDPEFTAAVVALLGENASRYGIAVLDITNPDQPRFAEHHGSLKQNVGSVGKLLVALSLFQSLADAWPDDLAKRQQVLRDSRVVADNFSVSDHHTIRLFDVETRNLTRRPLAMGDEGSLWEYLDWMLSVSSNSAAAMVMREAMLLEHFSQAYPVTEAQIRDFFRDTPAGELTRLFQRTFWDPVTRNGMDLGQIRQGSFFTAQGKRNVAGGGNSYATARSLMQFMLSMEKGHLVDEWSSRQIKRLLYMTERRIRYASSPALENAAVYFKSGSLFQCQPEEGFQCKPYHGNVINYMNSVAMVEEHVDGINGPVTLDYIVVVISNVLRKNSAVDHQTLATGMHHLIRQQHGLATP